MRDLLDVLSEASGRSRAQLASGLGVPENGSNREVATAILELPERVAKVEALLSDRPEGGQGAVPADVAHTLGLEPDADEITVLEEVSQLRGYMALNTVACELGLEGGADTQGCIEEIKRLQTDAAKHEAEKLVRHALEAGTIRPGQRDFYLRRARRDLKGTRQALKGLGKFDNRSTTGGADATS